MKKKVHILLLLFPLLDLITSILTRDYNVIISPGLIVKGFFMIAMFFYVLFSTSKYKKTSLIMYLSFFIYSLFYFVTKVDILSTDYILSEINYLFKLLFFPVIFSALICLYDESKIDKKEINLLLKINLISMSLLLIIPLIIGNAYQTYTNNLKGYIGWFYAGNEISNIMIMLFPLAYYIINKKNKLNYLFIFPVIFVLLSIGTKVALFGVILIVIIKVLYNILNEKKFSSLNVIFSLFIMLITFILSYNSNAVFNYNYSLDNYIEQEPLIIDESEIIEVNHILNKINNFYDSNKFNKIFSSLLSGRDIYLANTLSIYNNDLANTNIWFGIGFSNTNKINNNNIQKLIEIDILDGYFHYGIFGLLIMLSPFFITSYLIIKSRTKLNLDSIYYSLIILLVLAISTFSGHVLTAPSVSIYLILYLILLLNEFNVFERQIVLKNKISILSLHLGYGGIERAIVNQANMLCDKYNVEIICLYKVMDYIPYEIDNKVKIIYLSNLKPNKQDFLKSIKDKKIIKLISEGIKSINILYSKQSLIRKYIYNSDSSIIISTRLEFTKLLNLYGNKNATKIAEEHVYHNNCQKYFKKLKESLSNIDYLLPPSQYLTKDYKKIFETEKLIVKYIPNIVSNIPTKINKCNNNNIISVGRMSPEKGYKDLIEVYKLVNKINPKIKLTIVGDGTEMSNIKDLIKKEKLNINLTGFLNNDKLNDEYKKASLFVMTSLEESFGLVLIEAMSYGIPCFAFDSALGAKEIINNKNGKLIKNRNVNTMAKEIINYFKNNPNKSMINESRLTSKKYSFEQTKIIWDDFIEQITIK